jgi:hypothetical protein
MLATALAAAGAHIDDGIELVRPERIIERALDGGASIRRAVRPGAQVEPIAFLCLHIGYCTTSVC